MLRSFRSFGILNPTPTWRSPVDPKRMLVKRVVALEGDVVRTRPPCTEPEVRIPMGHVWIESENRMVATIPHDQ